MNAKGKVIAGTVLSGLSGLIGLDQAAAAGAEPPDSSMEIQLQEIIVTAEKRAENLQNVPVTVSAVTGNALAELGGTNIQDLNTLVPGLDMEAQGSYTLPAIRGVSTTLTTLGNEPNVAIYIDGVYYPVSFANFQYFNNIERIEVLKGPQGTLFGRNATGGAINIVTKDPSVTPTGSFNVGYGRFNEVDLNGYLSGALSDTLTADVAAYSHKDHGWAHNIFLNSNDGATAGAGVRSKWLLRVPDSAKFALSLDYSKENNAPANFMVGGDSELAPFGAVVAGQLGQTSTNFRVTNPVYQLGAALTAEFNLSSFDLISVTGLRQAHAYGHFDIDNTSFPAVELWYGPRSRSASEDLRVQSKDSDATLTWVIGLNGYYDVDTYDPFNVIFSNGGLSPPASHPQSAKTKTTAEAIYGQAAAKITDKFRVTLGARVGNEKVSANTDQSIYGVGPRSFSHTWGDFSPKLSVDYQFAPKTLGYATISKGFKGGAYNVGSVPPQGAPINPETLWAYEIGVKTDLTPNFRVNAAAFHYDYRNIQVQSFGASAVVAMDNNAAKAKMTGGDADLTWVVGNVFTDHDSLNATAGVAVLHSSYATYTGASLAVEQFTPTGIPAGDVIKAVDASGNELIDAPKFTFDLSLNYALKTSIGRFSVAPTAYYNSGYFLDAANSPRFKQPSFTRLNTTFNWESVAHHYHASLWGRNLTNVKQLGGVLVSALGPAANGYPPATYGISVGYSF